MKAQTRERLAPEKFGRVAAQAAKQNIIQRVRDAKRDIEKKNIIVNLGRTDAILPEKERSRASAIVRATAFGPSSWTSS